MVRRDGQDDFCASRCASEWWEREPLPTLRFFLRLWSRARAPAHPHRDRFELASGNSLADNRHRIHTLRSRIGE